MPPNQAAMGDAREVFTAYVEAFNSQQWARVVALYSDRPGFQWMENGKVVYASKDDVAKAYDWLREHAATYGFHRTVAGEAWHWEYLGDEVRPVARPGHKHERRNS